MDGRVSPPADAGWIQKAVYCAMVNGPVELSPNTALGPSFEPKPVNVVPEIVPENCVPLSVIRVKALPVTVPLIVPVSWLPGESGQRRASADNPVTVIV